MPFLFTHSEYCDMHFVYGYCDGNASAAVNEYRRRYPERRNPSKRVFVRVEQTLRDNGCLPSFAVHSERDMVRTINTRENILDMVQRRPCATYGFVPLGKRPSRTVKRNFIH